VHNFLFAKFDGMAFTKTTFLNLEAIFWQNTVKIVFHLYDRAEEELLVASRLRT